MDLSAELSENMADAFLLQVSDLSRTHEIHLVYGDLLKIILALWDYAEIMDQICDEWGLEGFHRAIYELRARNLRRISESWKQALVFIMMLQWKNASAENFAKQRTAALVKMLWFWHPGSRNKLQ